MFLSVIIDYFVKEEGLSPVVARTLAKKLAKYEDIKAAFIQWIDSGDFSQSGSLEINGYTPGKIHEIAPFLNGSGVYNFMVTLRDNPSKAEKYINDGFPRK